MGLGERCGQLRRELVRSLGTAPWHHWQGTALYLSCLAKGWPGDLCRPFLVPDSWTRGSGLKGEEDGVWVQSGSLRGTSSSQGSSPGLKQKTQTRFSHLWGGSVSLGAHPSPEGQQWRRGSLLPLQPGHNCLHRQVGFRTAHHLPRESLSDLGHLCQDV